ncbi:hypothetical protein [Dialister invisus]|uniref:hypothetical protein n=1 Tax=Dialister invisus TaxID=218538 RepID=UPI00352194BF
MSTDFWSLMLDALNQTTDKEWAKFVEKFDNERREDYHEILSSREYKMEFESPSNFLQYDFTFAA